MRTEYKEGELLTKEDVGLVFRDRVGREWKIVCLNTDQKLAAVVDKEAERFIIHDTENILSLSRRISDDTYDLCSFVGPYFTEEKKLRKFEFEGYMGEYPIKPYEYNCIQVAVGHFTTTIHNNLEILNSALAGTQYTKISKWKITMEELPND